MNQRISSRMIPFVCIVLLAMTGFVQGSAAESITGLATGSPITAGQDLPTAAHPMEASSGCLLMAMYGKGGAALTCISPGGTILWQTPISSQSGHVLSVEELPGQEVLVRFRWGDTFCLQSFRYSLADGALLGQSDMCQLLTEEQAADNNLGFRLYPAGNRHLMVEVHDRSASCAPMYFRLEDDTGTSLWQVEESDIGIWPIESVYPVEGGTILFGWHAAPAAVLINDSGEVVWKKTIGSVAHGIFLDEEPLPDGTLALLAVYQLDEPKFTWGGFLLMAIEPGSGDIIWETQWQQKQGRPIRMDLLLPLENGFLIADRNEKYAGASYLWVDPRGKELAYWESSQPGDMTLYSDIFIWQNRCWALVAIEQEARRTWVSRLEEIHFPY